MRIDATFRVHSVPQVTAALEGLVRVAMCQLREAREAGRPFPRLYESGVRYAPEDGAEEWLGPTDVYARGYGDCEDLVAWRVAELRLSGRTRAQGWCYSPRAGLIHCVVREGGRIVEDPSARLGMR